MKYLVLRAATDVADGEDLTKPKSWLESKRSAQGLTIEVADGNETDVGDLRSDPKNVVVADAETLLTLIKPEASVASASTDLRQSGSQLVPTGLLAVGAHSSPFDGQGVTVAVLDTGLDSAHPAFAGKEIKAKNFTNEGTEDDAGDGDGHGTHCAGTICGTPVDEGTDTIRVGVAPGVTKLVIGKVLRSDGRGNLEWMLRGMEWAALIERASIVSMSLGFDLAGNTKRLMDTYGFDATTATQRVLRSYNDIGESVRTLRAYAEARHPNTMFIAASGNESEPGRPRQDAGMPAERLFPIGAVGSSNGDNWTVAPFSNGRVQLVAPGVDVISAAAGGGWTSMSGTSMATPHAAGVAALWTQKLRTTGDAAIPGSLRSELEAHATSGSLAPGQDKGAVGRGMVQAPQ